MGQNSSSSTEKFIPESVEVVHDEIFRQARLISEIALLSYEEFLNDIDKLNTLSKKCLDVGGKQLIFAVKKGTTSTVLWKGTVRIACIKVNPETKDVDSYRLLNLIEFLKVLKTLQCQLTVAEHSKNTQMELSAFSASTLMDTVDSCTRHEPANNLECCICLERKPEVTLPCAHSYCLPCIEQWNVNHKTCPICRETLQSTDDTWVLSEVPEAEEISEEICSSLLQLIENRKEGCPSTSN